MLQLKDWDDYEQKFKDWIIKSNSAVAELSVVYSEWELEWASEKGTKLYRSKDRKGGINPFCSYMLNKKWTLEEEFNNHMLRFQQVTPIFIIHYLLGKGKIILTKVVPYDVRSLKKYVVNYYILVGRGGVVKPKA